ncbi:hypothetical protein ACFPVT_03465 [Corynebacterium choanae]|uniref:Uncharacterized protein n=1 Tax=Corynebacterium choanae TaxID=1862358 RepID=A0A3G6J967_9CORY|nr:hypothetical protein [Corynebacterium choanae]AZA14661.1 hypothetical protein CCHOA_11450 [Corynebacterium choanae]
MTAGESSHPTSNIPATNSEFVVGGHETGLPPAERYSQLRWYFAQHYPLPAPLEERLTAAHPTTAALDATLLQETNQWLRLLPDRLTHTAMVMLGAAVDHTMPGVAYLRGANVTVEQQDEITMLTPESAAADTLIVNVYAFDGRCGNGQAGEDRHLPEMAALAVLSGCRVAVVDCSSSAVQALKVQQTQLVQIVKNLRETYQPTRLALIGSDAGALLAACVAPAADVVIFDQPYQGALADSTVEAALAAASTCEQKTTVVVTHPTAISAADQDIVSGLLAAAQPVGGAAVHTFPGDPLIIEPGIARQRLLCWAQHITGKTITDPRQAVEEQVAAARAAEEAEATGNAKQ